MRFIRYLFICWLVLFACMQVHAQEQTRGFGTVTPPAASTKAGRTVALVVGVSDYPFVTPLNYAAEDALLMYDFLQSNAGGNVSPADIRLLVNEEATLQNVWGRGLSWIENTVKPAQGDRVIIYLAGHGDAIDADESFFLCHNVNPAGDKNNYFVSGALNIRALKKRIAKFSSAGAEVVLIMDACRSGDLPGARTGITNPFESVVERKAGETLMLSAGANQLAVEDRRWGRGHGIFTWYLVQGLSGKADENADGTVDFYELEQYTKTKVRKETQAMGRTQVPLFAASPSGMGWQGKADRTFLTKLETESLSSVNVGESIALARSTAESSWFTDSTLYAGFNELKKLVRAGKYLGEGSAEPIYTQLAAQFSADQLEPVRVYYMSALAGAGFEAINVELQTQVGYIHTPAYYSKRCSYLKKAKELQIFSGEINQLEDYLKLIEGIDLFWYSAFSGKEFEISQSVLDSLSALRNQFEKVGAYYFWMMSLSIDPESAIHFDARTTNGARLFNGLLDSCAKYAPNWPKVKLYELIRMPLEELTDAYGNEISNLLSKDPTNFEYLLMQLIYNQRRKPYDNLGPIRTARICGKLAPQPIVIDGLLMYINSITHPELTTRVDYWIEANALRNHYNFSFEKSDFALCESAVRNLYNEPIDEDVFIQNTVNIVKEFIQYASDKHVLSQFIDVLLNAAKHYPDLSRKDLLVISSLVDAYPGFEDERNFIDSLCLNFLEGKRLSHSDFYFRDTQANLIANRIISCQDIEQLSAYRSNQMLKLREFNYTEFKDEFILFIASQLAGEKGYDFPDSFADSLLKVCNRYPTYNSFRLYLKLNDNINGQSRLASLHTDSEFQSHKNIISEDSLGRAMYYVVESKYHCFHQDTLQLIAMLKECLTFLDTLSFTQVLMNLEPHWREYVAVELLTEVSIGMRIIDLVDLGMLDRAEIEYTQLSKELKNYVGFEFELGADLLSHLAAIKMFNSKGDYAKSAEIMERLIDICKFVSGGTPELNVPVESVLGPYDAFTQSKEYKAMMARVYTSPEK